MCKWSDPFSKSVLIDRGLDHNSLETLWVNEKMWAVIIQFWRHVLLEILDKSTAMCYTWSVIWSVTMTVRFHLFPFRTQKLSSLVPKIVRWKRRVKIGSRRLKQKPSRIFLGGFAFAIKRHLGSCTGETDWFKTLPDTLLLKWRRRIFSLKSLASGRWVRYA